MKPLYSKFSDSGWTAKNNTTYLVECLPIDELWPCVERTLNLYGKPFLDNLKNDISVDGMHFPILVVDVTRKELIVRKRQHGNNIRELPFDRFDRNTPNSVHLSIKHKVIWGGCQRYYAAKDLGYTHIDCARIPALNTARKLQAQMRAPYQKKYYSRTS